MNYPLEQLGDDAFQLLCQSLLTREFPGIQCYPLGQSDGGRDATTKSIGGEDNSFVMFQVKFTKDPTTKGRRWLLETMKKEIANIESQLSWGATTYVLMTNVSGSSSPDTGSMDELDQLFSELLPIPGLCLWRDDICRRLDTNWDLKLMYPQVLTGKDFLRLLAESQDTVGNKTRWNTIRSFVVDQYARDATVKFKQVNLQNQLLNLFVDVPVRWQQKPHNEEQAKRFDIYAEATRQHIAQLGRHEHEHFRRLRDSRAYAPGAASLLLDPEVADTYRWIVLQGAPGQGKSTVTQYLAQVHRIRLLENNEAFGQIPSSHRKTQVRLPIRVDLRDFATWLDKIDPFASKDEIEETPDQWQASLEAFIAAVIRHHAASTAFSTDDLRDVITQMPVLIIMDGLDEIAEITRREDAILQIQRGLDRLTGVGQSVQAIVTSRPAAFVRCKTLDEVRFDYLILEDLYSQRIHEYAGKWMVARGIEERERAEVHDLLQVKLSHEHIRDLARNPMQLAILLGLIQTEGASLPEKRTQLYDRYIQTLLNRETEKSLVVRDNRPQILSLHQYLAWVLHSQAQSRGGNGKLSITHLEELVRDYLARNGHDIRIASALFDGVTERFGALVSREIGTFEFEVQPLREFFAAKYLYETAPPQAPGDRFDRFDALARDPYWLNVTRFYAGCYARGELMSITQQLQELNSSTDWGMSAEPRRLAAALLSDWVFAQVPRDRDTVVENMIAHNGIRLVACMDAPGYGYRAPLTLPKGCGQPVLVQSCFNELAKRVGWDYLSQICRLLVINASPEYLLTEWRHRVKLASKSQKTDWLRHAIDLRIIDQVTQDELADLVMNDQPNFTQLNWLAEAGRFDYLNATPERASATLHGLLEHRINGVSLDGPVENELHLFAFLIYLIKVIHLLESPNSDRSLRESWNRNTPLRQHSPFMSNMPMAHALFDRDRIAHVLETIHLHSDRPISEWWKNSVIWNAIIESIRDGWGEVWEAVRIAVRTAHVRPATPALRGLDLYDTTKPLLSRAALARRRHSSIDWWREQLATASSEAEIKFALLTLLLWGNQRTFESLVDEINEPLEAMPQIQWRQLYLAIEDSIRPYSNAKHSKISQLSRNLLKKLSPRFVAAIQPRIDQETSRLLYQSLRHYDGNDEIVLETIQQSASLQLTLESAKGHAKLLQDIKRVYRKRKSHYDVASDWSYRPARQLRFLDTPVTIPSKQATAILADPGSYPASLLELAEAMHTSSLYGAATPVGEIARQQNWNLKG